MSGLLEWAIFLALSAIATSTAAGMLLTMSMYRAGLALMSSFVALAGLFILLDADLLAAIQIMMNVGGMLVMILFMVMMMMDPGGEMMWDMKRKMRLPGPGAFSMSMPREAPRAEPQAEVQETTSAEWTCPMHPEVRQQGPGTCPKCGMDLVPVEEERQPADEHDEGIYTCPMHPEVRQQGPGTCPKCGMHLVPVEGEHRPAADHSEGTYTCPMHPEVRQQGPGTCPKCGMDLVPADTEQSHQHSDMGRNSGSGMAGMSPRQHYQMMVDMAMSTAQLPWALLMGAISAVLLVVVVTLTPWPLSTSGPAEDATTMVGELLLSRYMIAFEGAAFLILAGIVGAVIFGKREATEQLPAVKEPMAGEDAADTQTYTCPMHPEVRQQGPRTCPKCGMELVPVEEERQPANEKEANYTWPMHADIQQEGPGTCPTCGMSLVQGEHAHQEDAMAANTNEYTCPMHPEVRQPGPGRCPKCGMDLVPADDSQTSQQGD